MMFPSRPSWRPPPSPPRSARPPPGMDAARRSSPRSSRASCRLRRGRSRRLRVRAGTTASPRPSAARSRGAVAVSDPAAAVETRPARRSRSGIFARIAAVLPRRTPESKNSCTLSCRARIAVTSSNGCAEPLPHQPRAHRRLRLVQHSQKRRASGLRVCRAKQLQVTGRVRIQRHIAARLPAGKARNMVEHRPLVLLEVPQDRPRRRARPCSARASPSPSSDEAPKCASRRDAAFFRQRTARAAAASAWRLPLSGGVGASRQQQFRRRQPRELGAGLLPRRAAGRRTRRSIRPRRRWPRRRPPGK